MTREEYQNRVLGCFVGKNIGGTLGMPMEWERSKNDVTYYTHDIIRCQMMIWISRFCGCLPWKSRDCILTVRFWDSISMNT